ncbi:hepatocyte growth factor-regulated tyrosine kinase substrate isoform X1 [Mus musculus]|uniref:hepatocyte growth factor-regulated tyrosine kinase substrate isoform X1 n=1 Tax=Mus musculus TaxID=10090 RepID=UPI0005ABB197|nr:hepatocyte growth factor-regulated tyrosine kinase substrate isoform X1 [Mus musculus]|eukprot:XP_006532333.2 PREDICTED: hepatocyte growth factor-regulated tyrosine kinase substrate isoform X1 [Mus musculus]
MGRGSGTFERLLDKATSQLLLETDWESILQICDLIRQGDTQAKYAVNSIKKKVNDKNPHVALYALEVMESVVKNCGQTVHDEVANKQTMEELKELLKRQVEVNVRNKILYLIQAWAHAFRNEPKYKVVQDTYQIMKVEGHVFPEFKESDAMFAAERAPDWVDAEECHRCRVQFGVVTRKHHCRACGQIFCGKCSSKYSTIPKFGIEKEVRVCEPCYEQLNKKAEGKASSTTELPPEYLTSPLSQQSQLPPKRDETALQEEEELQLALALSQSEAEEKERMRQKTTYTAHPKAEPTPLASSAPPAGSLYSSPVTQCLSPQNSSAPLAEDIDPELARYLNRNYWEKKQEEARKSPTPSAPVPLTEPAAQPGEGHTAPNSMAEAPLPETDSQPITPCSGPFSEQYQNGESEESHEQFLKALQNAVSTFVNRMKSNHMRGRSITNDSAVLSLFQSINTMHPQLLELLNQLDERRLYYEGLQDKLAQIRDARGALSALREEHREKLRRAAEEAERQRQIQLAQKLEIMRQKKQEYLEVQRQLAIQRLQEQEKERQMRLEQQKQTVQMRAQMPAFPLPYAQLQAMPTAGGVLYQPSGPTSFPATFSPAGSVEGSPMHGVYMSQPAPATGPYPSMPGTTADPSMVSAYMYPTGAPGAQAAPQAQAGPTTSPAYSSYQPTPTPGYQSVASQAPQSLPAISQPPQTSNIGYMGSQPMSMGYQPYNMQPGGSVCVWSQITQCRAPSYFPQNLMTALPGQDASLPAQQPYIPGQQPLYQQMAPSTGPPQQQPPVAQPAPTQGPPAQGSEAQLISFD